MNTIEIAAMGLRDDVDRMRTLSHNVANLTTPGYKRQVVVGASFASAVQAAREAAPVGGPTVHTDLAKGRLRVTGGALDLALGEREFLVVQKGDGALALSRGGALQLDAQGRLATGEGYLVQEAKGALTAPSTGSAVRLDAAGHLLADGRELGSLRIVAMLPDAGVTSIGDGLFDAPDLASLPAVQAPALHVGEVEASNVVASQEMVQIMTTMRHAESMAKLIQGADELIEKAIRKLGDMN